MSERALITGGAGFIGLHLAKELIRSGTEVVLIDDYSRGRPDDEFAAVRRDARVVRHDLRLPVPDDLLPPVDHVYHLAAKVGVGQSNRAPGDVLRTNVLATMNVLDWALRHKPAALFLSSTSEVGDGAVRSGLAELPAPETVPYVLPDPALPRAAYSLGKVVSEALLLHGGGEFRIRIGRYHNVYGPRMGYAHVIPQFIERLLDGENPFRIYGAHQTRSFCHVDDAVAATVAMTRLPAGEPLVANIGNDTEEITALALAERLFAVAGTRPEVEIHQPPPGSPDRRLPDLRVLRAATGHTPRVDLDTGLRQTYEWYAAARPERLKARS
ncbi:NAD-dependent epimerase/dehydratase family protein [Streptomyces sp. NPDC006798]|uniref:NAD-dependent epimerase/dehydratase family protein n=1 Tax=Streptomyces sp. NPDC006798 TaxID=3155462 RepID=UPI0033F30B31